MKKVIIDPTSRILYSSYYIRGLYEVFGKKNICFSSEYFVELKRKEETHSFDHYMAFVVLDSDNNLSKIVIDFRDKPSIKESAFQWCDKYAKVNFNRDLTEVRFHEKIISIPPGFGIKVWNLFWTTYYFGSNLIKCRFNPLLPIKDFFRDYIQQYRRPKLDDFLNVTEDSSIVSDKPFVFMIGTLWNHKNCLEGTNLLRKSFIEVCKALECNFKGGFYASIEHPQFYEFKEFVFSKRYSVENYIRNTKLSAIAFNTPAVHNCHGWKLGEYLAMGKAIISTPISNQLPEALVHGKNIHIISNKDELKDALESLLINEKYRKLLEDGAKAYFSKYASPRRVIEAILT
jgi:glycosyltransferase involved in cell wall biosynthesis